MEELPSETFSDENLKEYITTLEENLNWHAAILAVLLQEAGGVVEVDAEELRRINLSKAQAAISFDPENNTYKVEGLYTEDEV